jgi:transcriptional regulator with XRE-family HTH domain
MNFFELSKPIDKFSCLLIRLKIYRMGKQITQQEVADKLGLSIRTYQRLEQGLAPIEMSTLYKLTGPISTESDIPNVTFIESFENIPLAPNITPMEIQETFAQIISLLRDGSYTAKELYKAQEFKHNTFELFYSEPSFTFLNKSLQKMIEPINKAKAKESNIKQLSDYEFLIRLWEVCYKRINSPWFLTTTEHEKFGQMLQVLTLNRFIIHEGQPFNLGMVLNIRSI